MMISTRITFRDNLRSNDNLNFHYIRPVQRVSLLNNLQRFIRMVMKQVQELITTYDVYKEREYN